MATPHNKWRAYLAADFQKTAVLITPPSVVFNHLNGALV